MSVLDLFGHLHHTMNLDLSNRSLRSDLKSYTSLYHEGRRHHDLWASGRHPRCSKVPRRDTRPPGTICALRTAHALPRHEGYWLGTVWELEQDLPGKYWVPGYFIYIWGTEGSSSVPTSLLNSYSKAHAHLFAEHTINVEQMIVYEVLAHPVGH